jgi:hypothetical protein
MQALEDVIAFGLEVLLERELLLCDVAWLYEVNGSELHPMGKNNVNKIVNVRLRFWLTGD